MDMVFKMYSHVTEIDKGGYGDVGISDQCQCQIYIITYLNYCPSFRTRNKIKTIYIFYDDLFIF